MGDEEVFEIKRVDPKQPYFVSTIKLPEDILAQLEQGQVSEDDLSITFTKDGKGSVSSLLFYFTASLSLSLSFFFFFFLFLSSFFS